MAGKDSRGTMRTMPPTDHSLSMHLCTVHKLPHDDRVTRHFASKRKALIANLLPLVQRSPFPHPSKKDEVHGRICDPIPTSPNNGATLDRA